jgi:hypothetical protein
VRATEAGAFAWDFPAVLTMAELLEMDVAFVAELLPAVEPFVLRAINGDPDE